MSDLTRGKIPFDYFIDVWQPKGSTEMRWVDKDRLWELINMLSDELGNECDEEIRKVFPHWRYSRNPTNKN